MGGCNRELAVVGEVVEEARERAAVRTGESRARAALVAAQGGDHVAMGRGECGERLPLACGEALERRERRADPCRERDGGRDLEVREARARLARMDLRARAG